MNGDEVVGELIALENKSIKLRLANGEISNVRMRDINIPTLNRTRTSTALAVVPDTPAVKTGTGAGRTSGNAADSAASLTGAQKFSNLARSGKKIKVQYIDGDTVVRTVDDTLLTRVSRDGEHHVFKNATGETERLAWKYEGYTPDYSKIDDGIMIYRRGAPTPGTVRNASYNRAFDEAIESGQTFRARIGSESAELKLIKNARTGRYTLMRKVGDDLVDLPADITALRIFLGGSVLAEGLSLISGIEIVNENNPDTGDDPVPVAEPSPSPSPAPVVGDTPVDPDETRVDPDADKEEEEDEDEYDPEEDEETILDEGNPVAPPRPPNMRQKIHIKRGIF